MSGDESFLFEKKVGIIEGSICESSVGGYRNSNVNIRMTQNGFNLSYNDMDFVASTLEEAVDMTKKWFEDMIKEAKERKKES